MRVYEINNLDEEELTNNKEELHNLIDEYVTTTQQDFLQMEDKVALESLVSEYNYQQRRLLKSCRSLGYVIKVGDICFIDYGRAYLHEAGYQHFGLVINICYAKAFVIPMTSNQNTYKNAYDKVKNPRGMKNLMQIGLIEGLVNESVLFLNDAKFINTARIIDIKAHIDRDSPLFKEIVERLHICINEEI